MIGVCNIGQSNNGAAFVEAGNLTLQNQYLRLAQDGEIYFGRDANGFQIPSTEVITRSRYSFQQAAGAGDRYGYEGACNDRLIARGVTEPVLFIPQWAGGTSSLEWVANVGTNPDTTLVTDPVPVLRHRLRYALKMTNFRMGAIVIYQGESNATGDVGAGPADWGGHWTTICDNLLSFIADWGVTWVHASRRFIVVQLPPTNPNVVTFPDWDAQRTAIANWVAARPDAVLVQAPDGPYNSGTGENVHLAYGTAENNGIRGVGTVVADAGVDQFGFAT